MFSRTGRNGRGEEGRGEERKKGERATEKSVNQVVTGGRLFNVDQIIGLPYNLCKLIKSGQELKFILAKLHLARFCHFNFINPPQ